MFILLSSSLTQTLNSVYISLSTHDEDLDSIEPEIASLYNEVRNLEGSYDVVDQIIDDVCSLVI